MKIRYRIPPGVSPAEDDARPLLSTPQGGKVAVDRKLLSLWEASGDRTLEEVLQLYAGEGANPDVVRAGLACLSQAGLIERTGPPAAVSPVPDVTEGPLVSVVIVSYKSQEWLGECLPSLAEQTYSPLEIIVVDNGCLDGASDWVAEHFPGVRLVCLDAPVSFACATNTGVEAARGEYLFLLNPDVRLDPAAIGHLVAAARSRPESAAVGAKLKFWWAPSFLNGIGNRVGPFSWGTDNALGHLDLGQFDAWQELPSACYAAVLISKSAWQQAGPADEGFPMYYEDSEWSYRARLLGHPVLAAPQAVVYHAFGGRVPSGAESGLAPRKLRNVIYGRYRFALKLTGKLLPQFLRNYAVEDWANFTRALLQRDGAAARAYLGGWSDVLKSLPALLRLRRSLQSRRVIPDSTLFGLQHDMPQTFAWHGLPELTWDLVQHHYLPLIRTGRTDPMPEFDPANRRPHLLIVSNDVVDVKMAGPGMRYLEMARALASDLDVTLAVPNETALELPGLHIVRYWEDQPGSLRVLVDNCDVVLITGYMIQKFPFLAHTQARLVVDMYDPFVLENLHYYLKEPMESQSRLNEQAVAITNRLAEIGDFFICGNERQRDYWMGVLTANGRTNPQNFDRDPSLRSLLDVVGIGFPKREPRHHPFLRGVNPNVPADARIVLWGGGIWNWLDPLTLVKAWPQVIDSHPQARLVFLGTRHPNPLVPVHEMAEKTEKLAAEIGEKDKSIIFIEWVSYEDREALLCEADMGVTLHPIHVETRYSLRTRVLDYFWAHLPVLITDGDITSEWIREYGLGVVVPEFDVQAVANGLNQILDMPKEKWAPAFKPLQEKLSWPEAVEPLRQYCLQGRYAPDRLERGGEEEQSLTPGWRGALKRARQIWRTEGTRALMHRGWRYIQWRLSNI